MKEPEHLLSVSLLGGSEGGGLVALAVGRARLGRRHRRQVHQDLELQQRQPPQHGRHQVSGGHHGHDWITFTLLYVLIILLYLCPICWSKVLILSMYKFAG